MTEVGCMEDSIVILEEAMEEVIVIPEEIMEEAIVILEEVIVVVVLIEVIDSQMFTRYSNIDNFQIYLVV